MEHVKGGIDLEEDHERCNEELIEPMALISGFFESVPGTFIVLNNYWRLVYLKDYLKNIFTDDGASLIGRPLEEIFSKSFGRIIDTRVIELLLDGKENTILKYSNLLHKWFKVSAYRSDSAIFIRLEDVTNERMANRLMRLNQLSVDQAKDMVFWIKTGGHIIYANVASCDLLKYSREYLVKTKMPEINQSFVGRKWDKFVHDLKHAGSMTYESSLRANDGSFIPVEVTCNYLMNGDDDEYIMAFARDITQRKKEEKELKEAKTEAELYLDLMGHDISNMHQIALSQLETAQEILVEDGKLEMNYKELIDTPIQTLERSARLIDNVRKLQRLKTGEYKTEAVDICKTLSEVIDECSNVYGKDIFSNYKHENYCYVNANLLLKDVFVNIIGNAIKHSNGSPKICIDVSKAKDNGNKFYSVSIEDNGPGISDENKKVVFDRLKRGRTTARGTGLGLYIVKTLIESFGGQVKLEDRVPGNYTKGSRFIVYLPVAEDKHGE